MSDLANYLTFPLPNSDVAAELLLAADIENPVTMVTSPTTDKVRALAATSGPKAVTLARSSDDPEFLAELARHRNRAVRAAAACNSHTPWTQVTSALSEIPVKGSSSTPSRYAVARTIQARRPVTEVLELLASWHECSAKSPLPLDMGRWFKGWCQRVDDDPIAFVCAVLEANRGFTADHSSRDTAATFLAEHLTEASSWNAATMRPVFDACADPQHRAALFHNMLKRAGKCSLEFAHTAVALGIASDPVDFLFKNVEPRALAPDALVEMAKSPRFTKWVHRREFQNQMAAESALPVLAALDFEAVYDIVEAMVTWQRDMSHIELLTEKLPPGDTNSLASVSALCTEPLDEFPESLCNAVAELTVEQVLDQMSAPGERDVSNLVALWIRAHPDEALAHRVLEQAWASDELQVGATDIVEHLLDERSDLHAAVLAQLSREDMDFYFTDEDFNNLSKAKQAKFAEALLSLEEIPEPLVDTVLRATASKHLKRATINRLAYAASSEGVMFWFENFLARGRVSHADAVAILSRSMRDAEFWSQNRRHLVSVAVSTRPAVRRWLLDELKVTADELATYSDETRFFLAEELAKLVPPDVWLTTLARARGTHQPLAAFARAMTKLAAAS